MKIAIAWINVAVIGFATIGLAEPIPLPEPGPVSGPWTEMVFLNEHDATPEEAVRFRIVDDPEVGRALSIGPWLAGSWSARVAYAKDFPPKPLKIVGRYRTVDLAHTTPVVRYECYDDSGKRLSEISYYLPLSPQWKPFSLRFDKFLADTHHIRIAFGLHARSSGAVQFSQLETRPAGEHPLADLPEPELSKTARSHEPRDGRACGVNAD